MTCLEARHYLPGYVDGATRSLQHARLRSHLDSCANCRAELAKYHRLSHWMAEIEPAQPPADLAFRIHAHVSRQMARPSLPRRAWRRISLVFENILEPMAVPATGGLLSAVLTFALVAQNLFMGLPLGAVPNDPPTNLIQPARLESLAPFPVPGLLADNPHASEGVLVVEATLDARGDLVTYRILAGPDNPVMRHQLDEVLMFSKFRPEMSFGRATSGGHVILCFSEVRVRG
jgi:Putative zinc-finger